LLVGDVLATGYWATKISEITEEDTVLIIGAGPTGLCTLQCVMLKNPKKIIVCEYCGRILVDPELAGVHIDKNAVEEKPRRRRVAKRREE
jgi:D-arabinose 1-dehydrogenase-like Zn-dependent alcohol dehydrogenase